LAIKIPAFFVCLLKDNLGSDNRGWPRGPNLVSPVPCMG
jgi:hypothetical protein